MNPLNRKLIKAWSSLGPRFMPFADAASAELPLGRLLRLSLFQVAVGMAMVLLNGTLNRVMIVELGVSSSLVALMVSLPVLIAPLRMMLGHYSDHHRSYLGWRRVPYIWMGTMLQFGGLAIMPFALIVLSGDADGPAWAGPAAAALAFLLVGAGFHTTQTAGLALATDLAPPEKRHRVIALLYVMLLVGMLGSSYAFGLALATFSQIRLIQVIQATAVLTMFFNIVALWKQEARNPSRTNVDAPHVPFSETWRSLASNRRGRRLTVAVALGTAGFSMQDILLEPYGGEILKLSVSATTSLNALAALGALCGFGYSAWALDRGGEPVRLAALGLVAGIPALSAVIFAAPLQSPLLFSMGSFMIGMGGALFTVGMLAEVMALARDGDSGKIMGAWGAIQATAAGLAIGLSGFARDAFTAIAAHGALGSAMNTPASGYLFVYHIEIALMFVGLVAIGPLVGRPTEQSHPNAKSFGLAEYPG